MASAVYAAKQKAEIDTLRPWQKVHFSYASKLCNALNLANPPGWEHCAPFCMRPQISQNFKIMKIHKIYVKQLHFDIPNGPTIFTRNLKSQTAVHVEIGSSRLTRHVFEVELTIKITMRGVDPNIDNSEQPVSTDDYNPEDVIYQLALVECGIFELEESQVGRDKNAKIVPVLISEGGPILHPYARADIDTTLIKSGFPPINLTNFDYKKMIAKGKTKTNLDGSDLVDNNSSDKKIIIH